MNMFHPEQPLSGVNPERKNQSLEENSWNKHQLETLTKVMENNPDLGILDVLYDGVIAAHPEFAAFKDVDEAPSVVTQDSDGTVYIRKGCRCKDGKIRILGIGIRMAEDEYGKHTKTEYLSQEISER